MNTMKNKKSRSGEATGILELISPQMKKSSSKYVTQTNVFECASSDILIKKKKNNKKNIAINVVPSQEAVQKQLASLDLRKHSSHNLGLQKT